VAVVAGIGAAVEAVVAAVPVAGRVARAAVLVRVPDSKWGPAAADATGIADAAVPRIRPAAPGGWSRVRPTLPIAPIVPAAARAHHYRPALLVADPAVALAVADPAVARAVAPAALVADLAVALAVADPAVARAVAPAALVADLAAALAVADPAVARAVAPAVLLADPAVVAPAAALAVADPAVVRAVALAAVLAAAAIRRLRDVAAVAVVVAAARGAMAAVDSVAAVAAVRGTKAPSETRWVGPWQSRSRPTRFGAPRRPHPRPNRRIRRIPRFRRIRIVRTLNHPSPTRSSPALGSASLRHRRRCNVTETSSEVALALGATLAWRLLFLATGFGGANRGVAHAQDLGGGCRGAPLVGRGMRR
jgi:hypothetical protein